MSSNIEKFLSSEATELLSDQEMILLDGGRSEESSSESSEINALSHCGSNNCHGGNCAAGCSGSKDMSES